MMYSSCREKEMARDALSSGSNSGMSGHKRQQKKRTPEKNSEIDRSKQGTCPHCKKTIPQHRKGRFGWNSKPFEVCIDCFRDQRQQKSAENSSASANDGACDAGIDVLVGHVSAIGTSQGAAYNRRHSTITADVPRKETVADDTCLHDDLSSLEQHWWRVIDYLILCGNDGIILNPQKFRFARTTVDFAGFRVSESSIEPLPKYIDAIRDFPVQKPITHIRFWFGLLNQVANY